MLCMKRLLRNIYHELTFSKEIFEIPPGLEFGVFQMDWACNWTRNLKRLSTAVNQMEMSTIYM